ncbi:putative transporter [Desulfovibrio sp. DV]|uniref:ABC transporter permease n=1 Tax=Desulfovibrio sp. DV TaxID=1844708 RepID=UPI00094BA871|nr:ABC transporter permease [Desulfovibrio sp. DV]OLN25159.1 putative transporter [Desulfovibrio sp. DV]
MGSKQNEAEVLIWLVTGLLRCGAAAVNPLRRAKTYLRSRTVSHLAWVGADSLGIVSIIAACVGIILALQAAIQLEKVGAMSYVANLVGFSLVTELGPLLTCLILSGRAGAAFTAEIATMQISEEIDALTVMGIEPVRFLVWPKFVAMAIMAPLLTLWADAVGITAGGVFASLALGLSGKVYFEQTAYFLGFRDLLSGLVKSAGFGVAITVISCWQGFLAREGAADVGRRTTRAVVQSIFVMILLDLFFTALNYIFR